MNDVIRSLVKEGYPYKIKGNDGYVAVLSGVQPLVGHDHCAVYRYPGGECCHSFWEIRKYFEVIEQEPKEV